MACPFHVYPTAHGMACTAGSQTPLKDDSDGPATPIGRPVSGNVLDNATLPPAASASVVSFNVEGSTRVNAADGSSIALADPVTRMAVGTLTLQPSGAYTFVPTPNYVGPVPAIWLTVRSSDGQTVVSALTIDVIPGGWWVVCSLVYRCGHTALPRGTAII